VPFVTRGVADTLAVIDQPHRRSAGPEVFSWRMRPTSLPSANSSYSSSRDWPDERESLPRLRTKLSSALMVLTEIRATSGAGLPEQLKKCCLDSLKSRPRKCREDSCRPRHAAQRLNRLAGEAVFELHSWRPQHSHCAFGSATVEAPGGCEVASNRLASITRLASTLTTDTRNGNSMRVPAIGASATSISRPSERYLMSGVDARWPAIGSYLTEHTTT
jgi:hypothetical protein